MFDSGVIPLGKIQLRDEDRYIFMHEAENVDKDHVGSRFFRRKTQGTMGNSINAVT
jgi:hypothetical protein